LCLSAPRPTSFFDTAVDFSPDGQNQPR